MQVRWRSNARQASNGRAVRPLGKSSWRTRRDKQSRAPVSTNAGRSSSRRHTRDEAGTSHRPPTRGVTSMSIEKSAVQAQIEQATDVPVSTEFGLLTHPHGIAQHGAALCENGGPSVIYSSARSALKQFTVELANMTEADRAVR